MARLLILLGIALVAAGLAWLAAERLGLGRLPGDFAFERGNTRISLPLGTSLLISAALTLLFWRCGR